MGQQLTDIAPRPTVPSDCPQFVSEFMNIPELWKILKPFVGYGVNGWRKGVDTLGVQDKCL